MHTFNTRPSYAAGLFVTVLMVTLWGVPGPLLVAQKAPRLNRMIEALESGQPAFASDTWTWIEQEHAPLDLPGLKKTLDSALAKRNAQGQVMVAPLVRIPIEGDEVKTNRWIIKQVLEAGAMGLLIPRVDTAQQALDVVESMRYPQKPGSKYLEPAGRRGCCSFPANWGLKDAREYWDGGKGDVWPLNPAGELFAMPMIESPDGVKNLAAILKVPGVSGIMIGTSDISITYGEGWVTPQNPTFGPKTEAAFQQVFKTCVALKKPCGIVSHDDAATKKYVDMGARIIRTLYQRSAAAVPATPAAAGR